jgi:hypothetical protein
MKTFTGIPPDSLKHKTLDDTLQQREAFYEAFWRRSLFGLQLLGEQNPRSHLRYVRPTKTRHPRPARNRSSPSAPNDPA